MMIRIQILGLIYAVTGSQQATEHFNLWPNAKMRNPVSIQRRRRKSQGSEFTFSSSLPQIKTQHCYHEIEEQINIEVVWVHCLRSDQVIIYNFNEKKESKVSLNNVTSVCLSEMQRRVR